MPQLSIIVPLFNEINNPYLEKQIELFKKLDDTEVIFVSGKQDFSHSQLKEDFPFPLIYLPHSNRAERLNKGINEASSDYIILHHPRSLLSLEGINFYRKHKESLSWGGFTHSFDQKNPLLSFTSWYSNHVRLKLKSIVYLDHCLFFNKSLLDSNNYLPPIDIFEDTAFSEKLKRLSPATLIPFPSITSSVRFNKNGLFFQSLLNQILKVCWLLRFSPESMNKVYEKGLELNSKYSS